MDDELMQRTIKRRQQKMRKPKWKRVLHRYWPPIRFALICLALVVLIAGMICLIVKLAKNRKEMPDHYETTAASAESTISAEDIGRHIDATLQKAENIAIGYDYQGAINLLQSDIYYSESQIMQQKVIEYQEQDGHLISYPEMNNITHVFFHTLIVDTDRAFDSDYTNAGYNQYMTTISEFNAMLESMYKKGYVLVSPYDVAHEVTDESGTHFAYGDIRIPAGKIPFIMSQDDVCYYGYMIGDADETYEHPASPTPDGDGFAHKVIIGEDGYPTCLYMDANGNVTAGDYDLIPLLEKFIQKHPDFAYHGARAIIAMTGYEGVLGYRTNPEYEHIMGSEAFQQEISEAKAVANCLREHGWILASHSFGHPAYGSISAERVAADSDKWEQSAEKVVGEVDILIYPHGSDIAGIEMYDSDNAKFTALYEDGFRYFFNVDAHYAWSQLGDHYFRGGRRNLDGYRMYYNPDMLDDLFDVKDVFDKARPTPVPSI